MMSVIQAEYLKLKRTFTRKLIVGAPLFFAVLAVWLRFALKGSGLGDWELILSVIYPGLCRFPPGQWNGRDG